MKKSNLLVLFAPTLLTSLIIANASFASVSPRFEQANKTYHINRKIDETPSNEKVTIHVLHQEDYIDESLLDEFRELYPNCNLVFDTTDTNETMYNELKTGKADYNVVTCSEYMIQRLASENLILKINNTGDKAHDAMVDSLLNNAKTNVSKYLVNDGLGTVDKINVYDKETKKPMGTLSDYTVGYMWGTLGSVVNPYFNVYQKRGFDKDYIVNGLRSDNGWHKFWEPDFKGTHSIKESMRDTYALGIFEVYHDEFLDPSKDRQYKNDTYFNDSSKETIANVKDKLIELKSNIFGFEVDSGKNDIVTGKIGMNLAWSGDAAFSILQGEYYPGKDESYEEEKPESKKTKLYYNIPSIGSNIWFDGFAMPRPKDDKEFEKYLSSEEFKYTLRFLDFMSQESSVVANMSTTGYTSFMSGEPGVTGGIQEFVLNTFTTDYETATVPYDISYFFNNADQKDMTIMIDPDSYEGRLICAQYPKAEDIDHLYIMEDYGENNAKIVQMWEDVKVNPLPIWIVVVLIIFTLGFLGYLGSYKLIKAYKVKKRKSLRETK